MSKQFFLCKCPVCKQISFIDPPLIANPLQDYIWCQRCGKESPIRMWDISAADTDAMWGLNNA